MARFGAERANERARISRGCTWAWHSDRSREGRTMHRSAHRGVGFPPMSARASVHCQGQAAPPSLVVPISATRSRGPSGAIKSPIKTGEACPFITVRAPRPSVYPLGARQTADRQFAEICGCVPPTSSLRYSLSTRPLSKRLAMYCNLPPFRCGPMQSAHLLELGKNPRKKGH